MQGTIEAKGAQLRAHRWRKAMSRAAVEVRYLTGIEQKYHETFLATGIDVETFLRPFQHLDVLLAERGITVYDDSQGRMEERATLYQEYAEYLKRIGKEKAYRTIEHDITVLDTVRLLRSEAKSSLDAGALFMTCDYTLYRFDWETSRDQRTRACTVLPNLFWQVLRPFIPQDEDFDRAFAETFALPEFRTVNSDTGRVASKMIGILNSYKDVTEETAKHLLSYDVLYNGLQHMGDDRALQEYIESEIAKENAFLQDKAAALGRQVHMEKAEKAQIAGDRDREREEREQTAAALERERQERVAQAAERQREQAAAAADLARERAAREQAERTAARMLLMVAVIGVAVVIGGIEFAMQAIPLTWVLQHPQSYSLRATFYATILLGVLGWIRPGWRKWCWGTGVLAFVAVLFQILGGPPQSPGK